MLIGYARVSTRRQRLNLQHKALEAAKCDLMISEWLSGGGGIGQGLTAAINACGKGDLLVVSAASATAGQKVFAVLATGLIVAGAAGATIAGAIETNWRIVTSASAGDVFQISNW